MSIKNREDGDEEEDEGETNERKKKREKRKKTKTIYVYQYYHSQQNVIWSIKYTVKLSRLTFICRFKISKY